MRKQSLTFVQKSMVPALKKIIINNKNKNKKNINNRV